MKPIKVVAFAVLCVCMAATASASAHEFHASIFGTLKGLSVDNQVFTVGSNNVTCTMADTIGNVTALLGLHQLVEVVYSKCLANGAATADVTRAQYLLSADGLVAIENTIKILVLETMLTAHCTITVRPQDLGTIKYDTNSNALALLELSEIHSIKSLSSGEPCGPVGEDLGTYAGKNLIGLFGGTLSWT